MLVKNEKSSDEKRDDSITVGQACNLAHRDLEDRSIGETSYTDDFKRHVRFYYELIKQLKKELV